MLVLTRRQGEWIALWEGDRLIAEVRVKRTKRGECTLAIRAPESVRVLRGELEPTKEGSE